MTHADDEREWLAAGAEEAEYHAETAAIEAGRGGAGTMTKTWDGGVLKPCTCGADSWESQPDSYGHFDNWEQFRCRGCGRIIKVALPDA